MAGEDAELPGPACWQRHAPVWENFRVLMSKFNPVSCCFGQISISILNLFFAVASGGSVYLSVCYSPITTASQLLLAQERLCSWRRGLLGALPSGNLDLGPALAQVWGPPASLQPARPCCAAVFLLAS